MDQDRLSSHLREAYGLLVRRLERSRKGADSAAMTFRAVGEQAGGSPRCGRTAHQKPAPRCVRESRP